MNTTPKPKIPKLNADSVPTKARRWFYSYKILNLFWFADELPDDPEKTFPYFMNPDWPDGAPLPDSFRGILKLSEAELIFICKRLSTPEWMRSPYVLKGKTSLKGKDTSWPLPEKH